MCTVITILCDDLGGIRTMWIHTKIRAMVSQHCPDNIWMTPIWCHWNQLVLYNGMMEHICAINRYQVLPLPGVYFNYCRNILSISASDHSMGFIKYTPQDIHTVVLCQVLLRLY